MIDSLPRDYSAPMLLPGELRDWFIYNRVIFKPNTERELSNQITGILLIYAEAFQCVQGMR